MAGLTLVNRLAPKHVEQPMISRFYFKEFYRYLYGAIGDVCEMIVTITHISDIPISQLDL